jgi:hypothetical protein
MNGTPRLIALLPESTQVTLYLTECRLVVTMMTGNANFATPTPSLAKLTTHLDTLEAAEVLASKGGKGAVQQRDVELAVVQNDMRLLTAFVQSIADANVAAAEAIITSAGLKAGKKPSRKKPAVSVRQGKSLGSVVLDAKALPPPVQYRWQMSVDQKVWTDVPESFKASVTVAGLTAATIYYFRLRTMTNDGLSDWSVVVSIIAH